MICTTHYTFPAPGWDRGMEFPVAGKAAEETSLASTVNLAELLHQQDHILDMFHTEVAEESGSSSAAGLVSPSSEEEELLVDSLEREAAVLAITEAGPADQPRATQWAEMLDAEAPLTDFHQRVPQVFFTFFIGFV